MTIDRRKDKQHVGHPYKEILLSNQGEKKKLLIHVKTCMNLRNFILWERSQT